METMQSAIDQEAGKGVGADGSLAAAYAHCDQLAREGDHDRWLAALFAPADKRPHLNALYAFSLEIARVRDHVSEPLPGELRFQWWRDALEGEARGDARAHPVAAALIDTIERFRLPKSAFLDLIDARIFDLYDDPMPDMTALEAYCGETSSAIIRLGSIVLADGRDPGGADAAGHAGVAYAITGLLRAFPWHAARGQVFVPKTLFEPHGATREEIVSGQRSSGLDKALGQMRELARKHLQQTRALSSTIAEEIAPAFLPLSLVEGYLKEMERPGYDPFKTVIDRPVWRKQWALWRAARKAGR